MATPNRGEVPYVNEQLVGIELRRQCIYSELGNVRSRIIEFDQELDLLRKLEQRIRQSLACE